MIISDLYFYPIKSFRGFRTKELNLLKRGAELDREWMLVDDKLQMLTQRQLPQLARIGVQLDGFIELTLDGFGSVDFGLEEMEGKELSVNIWRSQVPAHEVNSEVSEWLSQVLSRPVKLVRLSEKAKRHSADHEESLIRFHDQQPLLVISKASLKDLESRAKQTLSMSRFRPNIVVDGATAFAEDGWPKFTLGSVEFKPLKACTRCKITQVHPLTGEVGEEPLKTLLTYRKGEKGVAFGYYYGHLNNGKIHVGQELKL